MSNISSVMRKVYGYPVLFDVPYDMGPHWEQIAPGCFDKADFSEIRLLRDHNSSLLLARYGTPTLTVKVDDKGLFFRAELPNTELGRETATLIDTGVLTQMSWGWAGTVDQWSTYKGRQLRIITAVRTLYDISLVTYPANPAAWAKLDPLAFSSPTGTTRTTNSAPIITPTSAKAPKFDMIEEEYLFRKMIMDQTPEACKEYQSYLDQFKS